jgi:hypothetical protein
MVALVAKLKGRIASQTILASAGMTAEANRLVSFTPLILYAAAAAMRCPAYGGFNFLTFRARMLAERSVPLPLPRNQEVYDGQPHAILH